MTKSVVLNWLGNKSNHPVISELVLLSGTHRRLVDPFAGTCAAVLHTNFQEYKISDGNPDLIMFLRTLRDYEQCLHSEYLRLLDTDYYKIRDEFNSLNFPATVQEKVRSSALFLALSKYCFNGVLRYNRKGEINTPKGDREYGALDWASARVLSRKLSGISLDILPWKKSLQDVVKGDVVFLDPPYHTEKTGFTYYNKFDESDQIELAKEAIRLRSLGCTVIVCNSDTDFILDVHKDADRVDRVSMRRNVSGSSKTRPKVYERIFFYLT